MTDHVTPEARQSLARAVPRTREELYELLRKNQENFEQGWLQEDQYRHNVSEITRELSSKSASEWDAIAKLAAQLEEARARGDHFEGRTNALWEELQAAQNESEAWHKGAVQLAAQLEEAQKVIDAARSHVHDWTSINTPDLIPLPIAEIRDALAAYDEQVKP